MTKNNLHMTLCKYKKRKYIKFFKYGMRHYLLNYLQIDFICAINSSKLSPVDSGTVCSSSELVDVDTVYACRTPGVGNTHGFSSD